MSLTGNFIFDGVLLGVAGVIAGALFGQWLSNGLPQYRRMLPMVFGALLAAAVLSGLAVDNVFDTMFGYGRQALLIGFFMGASIAARGRRLADFATHLAIAALVGTPVLTNIWFGLSVSGAYTSV